MLHFLQQTTRSPCVFHPPSLNPVSVARGPSSLCKRHTLLGNASRGSRGKEGTTTIVATNDISQRRQQHNSAPQPHPHPHGRRRSPPPPPMSFEQWRETVMNLDSNGSPPPARGNELDPFFDDDHRSGGSGGSGSGGDLSVSTPSVSTSASDSMPASSDQTHERRSRKQLILKNKKRKERGQAENRVYQRLMAAIRTSASASASAGQTTTATATPPPPSSSSKASETPVVTGDTTRAANTKLRPSSTRATSVGRDVGTAKERTGHEDTDADADADNEAHDVRVFARRVFRKALRTKLEDRYKYNGKSTAQYDYVPNWVVKSIVLDGMAHGTNLNNTPEKGEGENEDGEEGEKDGRGTE